MRAHLNFNRIAYFTAVADTGSFTAAAEKLGITKAVVSQQVARLEQEAGTALFVRNTRRIYLTDAGRAFYSRCSSILHDVESAFDELTESAGSPTGLLRLTAPIGYGHCMVAPAMAEYCRLYPGCRAALTLTDKIIDILDAQIDIAIRIGFLSDSSLHSRRIGTATPFFVCSSVFAEQAAAIREPDDIKILPFIANMASGESHAWEITNSEGEQRSIHFRASLMLDTMPGIHAAVVAGGGVSVLPEHFIRDDMAAGRLIRLLPDWHLRTAGIYAVYPAARFRAPKIRAFVDLLVKMQKVRDSIITSDSARAAP
ncbi:LysR family transcriptional regulator [Phyllobacterium lublinensis]|uniref:LysR family transcriptional regulator n=1 Tax=Phyllobacterium lublinensis TaxID=2875708 RepID=UPI001CCC40A8|nr:LysR family transcriptional regulator [Phyllobacterium sp. 2063]MBZ9657094.1 LysR family transcriptional regulator [Phyllobacterium sp. 2063]